MGDASWLAEQQRIQQRARETLQNLWREWPGCTELAQTQQESTRGLRAFWADGEAVLLKRSPNTVQVVSRGPVHSETLGRIERQMRSGEPQEDGAWRALLEEVSLALLSDLNLVETNGTVAPFSLHGRLQSVPLAALPLSAPEGGYLIDRVLPVLQTAGAQPNGLDVTPGNTGLFLVDPERNLEGTRRAATLYEELFPQATVSWGEAATRMVLLGTLDLARPNFLHIDAHAVFDEHFPELSAIRLADGPVRWLELSDQTLELEFANLSACRSGTWRSTADSGSFGLAGLLRRLGTSWVVASLGDLDNRLATEFNAAFYAALKSGGDRADRVQTAYKQALDQVRVDHPPSAWSRLLLLGSPGRD